MRDSISSQVVWVVVGACSSSEVEISSRHFVVPAAEAAIPLVAPAAEATIPLVAPAAEAVAPASEQVFLWR